MEELFEIFKQVEEMVEAQGHTIDNIENDILKAEVNVHYGNMVCRVFKGGEGGIRFPQRKLYIVFCQLT